MISSANRWALMHETGDGEEATLDDLVAKMQPADLLLVEGYKREAFSKLEVHRLEVGRSLMAPDDRNIVAIAVDRPVIELDRPQLDLNDVSAIADFIVSHCGLGRGKTELGPTPAQHS